MVDIGQTQSIKKEEADQVPREEKRDIEPAFLSVKLMVQPREKGFLPEKEKEKKPEREGEESHEGIGDILEGPTPTGLADMGHRRE
jgi:hypothetical protein